MKSKLEEYLLDFVEKDMSPAEAAGVAREVAASATLRAEVAALEAVRAEVKNAANAAARAACAGVDLGALHARIMLQIDPAYFNPKDAEIKKK